MKHQGQLLPDQTDVHCAESGAATSACTIHREVASSTGDITQVVFTRNHDAIKRWAAERRAEPATGEATRSGPATVTVNDGGAGIRFNFPGHGPFRPISWEEWLSNFDQHGCAFVFDDEPSGPPSNRYRIVRARDWTEFLP
jgi:hypothetical protein